MLPAYFSREPVLCVRTVFFERKPDRGKAAVFSYGSDNIFLLKRIIALEQDTVEFRNGICYVNGSPLNEPYVKMPCSWNLPLRTVKPGHVYVMGDNRSMPISLHKGGQIRKDLIRGFPLW